MSTLSQFFGGGSGGGVGTVFSDPNPRPSMPLPDIINQDGSVYILETGEYYQIDNETGQEMAKADNNLPRLSPWTVADENFPYSGVIKRINNKIIIYEDDFGGVWTDDMVTWTSFSIPNPRNISAPYNSMYEKADGSFFVLIGGGGIYDSHYFWETSDGINWVYKGENYLQTQTGESYNLGNMRSPFFSPDKQRIIIPIVRNLNANNSLGLNFVCSNDGGNTWFLEKMINGSYEPLTVYPKYDTLNDKFMVVGGLDDGGADYEYREFVAWERGSLASWTYSIGFTGSSSPGNRFTNIRHGDDDVLYVYYTTTTDIYSISRDANDNLTFTSVSTLPPAKNIPTTPEPDPTDTSDISRMVSNTDYLILNSLAAPFVSDQSYIGKSFPSVGGTGTRMWVNGDGLYTLVSGVLFYIPDFFIDITNLDIKTTFITSDGGQYRRAL